MAITIPKLAINTSALHSARRKLQTKQADDKIAFSAAEREALLALISAGKRKIYPTQQSVNCYLYNLDEIIKIDPLKDSHQFDLFAKKIKNFQERYCE